MAAEEERDDLIELIDEDGKEMKFEYLATIDMSEAEYVVLLPFQEEGAEGEEVDEVVILKIEYVNKSEAKYKAPGMENVQEEEESTNSEDDKEEIFVSVDDEAELNTVFEEFKKRIRDQYSTENTEQ